MSGITNGGSAVQNFRGAPGIIEANGTTLFSLTPPVGTIGLDLDTGAFYRYQGGWNPIGGSYSTADLQQVTDVGNTTTNNIVLTDSGGFSINTINEGSINITDGAGSTDIYSGYADFVDTSGNLVANIQPNQLQALNNGTNAAFTATSDLITITDNSNTLTISSGGVVTITDAAGNLTIFETGKFQFKLAASASPFTLRFPSLYLGSPVVSIPATAGTLALLTDLTLTNVLTAGGNVISDTLTIQIEGAAGNTVAYMNSSTISVATLTGGGNFIQIKSLGTGQPTVIVFGNASGVGYTYLKSTNTGATANTLTIPAGSGALALAPATGNASVTGNITNTTYTVAHGLGYSPTQVNFTPTTAGAQLAWYGWDGTNFIFNFSTPPGAISLKWNYAAIR